MTKIDLLAAPPARRRSGALPGAAFSRFAAFITAELGIKMPDDKATLLRSRLQRRMRELGMESIDQYGDYFFASAHAEEREHLINAITTNKTDFFREPQHFAYLTKTVLPAADCAGARFKVWCAGCSSGEEPYTLAMVLADYANQRPGFDFAILATDISTRVLASARNGIYSEAQIAPVPPRLRRNYLLASRKKEDGLVRIRPELRKKVSFHRLNFMDGEYLIRETFDVVFFRNVLIYFDRNTQEAVLNKICSHLAAGGYLFASHSESLAGLDIPLKPVQPSVYRKNS